MGFRCGSAGKESSCNAGDLGLIPVLGSSPGEGKSYPLQYSGLENSIDCKVHGVEKSWTQLRDFNYFYSVRRKKWKNFIFIAFLPLGEGTNIQKCVIYTSIKVFWTTMTPHLSTFWEAAYPTRKRGHQQIRCSTHTRINDKMGEGRRNIVIK